VAFKAFLATIPWEYGPEKEKAGVESRPLWLI
jgi:hypothetical protein